MDTKPIRPWRVADPMHACSHHPYAQAPAGRQRHAPCHCLERHCHDTAFVTVVLGGSYLEAGYGRNDVFRLNRYRRVLVTGHVTWGSPEWRKRGLRPYVSMLVDGDASHGADTVQTSIGMSFDLDKIF